MGQVQDEAVGLLLHAADDHQRLAEVALGVARRMGQRHENLPGLTAVLWTNRERHAAASDPWGSPEAWSSDIGTKW